MLCSTTLPQLLFIQLMAQVDTRAPRDPAGSGKVKTQIVLVVLVVKDAEAWLPQCLMGLAKQTHPRIGILAVDDGSADRSPELLEASLGPSRVIRLAGNTGFGGAASVALGSDAAKQADYVLFLHDDTFLEPEAVAALVEAAQRIEGVGIVGPKVLDWEQPQVLREIGLSTDRFAYPYSPLEDGEIDQGQYDRIREVMYVSSCAMLVSRNAWSRVGLPDERLASNRQDLDFCWRARLAGFRVLMTPRSVARHRSAGLRGERTGSTDTSLRRYDQERGALASILKNYGLLSLAWILPVYVLQGLIRLLFLGLSRRFQDAYQLVAAWGWNIVHLPGTLRRRVRAQAVRSLPDRAVRRAMAPTTIRLRRWAQAAGQALLPEREAAEEPEQVGTWTRAFRFARNHPVATAWVLAAVTAAFAYRHLLGASPLVGGGVGSVPPSPSGFFEELLSGIRHTGLGGATPASPALGLLGAGSILALGNPALLQKILLVALPFVAAIGCYRSVRASTSDPIPSVVAGACYGLSSAVLWAISEGRIPALIFLAGLPWMAGKLVLPFEQPGPIRIRRWIVGAALGLVILGSFYVGAVLAAGVLVAAVLLIPPNGARRVRGLVLVGVALFLAALLAFPLSLELARGSFRSMEELAGDPSFGALARLSLGPGPGSWVTGFFLPAAAGIALLFISPRHQVQALRAGVAAVLSLYLGWLAAAGYLPAALSNPVAYIGLAAFSYSFLVGLGLTSLLHRVSRSEFGFRQLGTALTVALLAVGLTGQLAQAGSASWEVGGPERIPAAYPVAGEAGGPPYRVLWLGSPDGDPFPAPGGLPTGTVPGGAASARFAVTDPAGSSALDTGRPDVGPGYDRLRQSLVEILAGETRHGGALLAVFGIRFVLAEPGDLPGPTLRRLARQVDLDLVSARGLTIFRNDKAVPLASEITNSAWTRAATSSRIDAVESLPAVGARSLTEDASGQVLEGPAQSRAALVLLLDQFDPRWRLEPEGAGRPVGPDRAFGWATGFRTDRMPSGYRIHFGGQRIRTIQVILLILLWGAALWVTRRPVRDA
jgi:GT2 family glycosyltransferase